MRLFDQLNDADIRPPTDDAFELVAGVADGTLRDVRAIAARLAGWRKP